MKEFYEQSKDKTQIIKNRLLFIVFAVCGGSGSGSLGVLNQVFKNQAVENIRQFQKSVEAELLADTKQLSMRLSHLAYVNQSAFLTLASQTDTTDVNARYQSVQDLSRAAGYAIEPVKDVVSVAFYMKDDIV